MKSFIYIILIGDSSGPVKNIKNAPQAIIIEVEYYMFPKFSYFKLTLQPKIKNKIM